MARRACGVVLAAAGLAAAGPVETAPAPREPRLKVLAAEPRAVVLTGGPQLASGKDSAVIGLIRRHYDGRCPHRFEVAGGHHVLPTADECVAAWVKTVTPALARARESKLPVVVLAHTPPHMMGLARDDARVRSADDAERIGAAADVLEGYARKLRGMGADLVVFTDTCRGPRDVRAGNPDRSHAHFWRGYAELDRRAVPGVVLGPRLFQLGRDHPGIYQKDGHHVTKAGLTAVAHAWYQALCRLDGLDPPAWSVEELAALSKSPTPR